MSATDRNGLSLSTNDHQAAELYDTAVDSLNRYRGDPCEALDAALLRDPEFISAHIMRAEVQLTMWEQTAVPAVVQSLQHLRGLEARANDRERQHIAAIAAWANGNWREFSSLLDQLSLDYPHDLLALQVGHQADFFLGDRDNLRGRIARALPHWHADMPGYSFLLGMYAFGLEECGDYPQAEETGRLALDKDPEDCWAQHAVAHVMEMQSRQAEAIDFMESRQADWSQSDNGFAFHNWWHTALFYLDQDRFDRVLEIYDQGVRPEPEEAQLAMLDAAALLWRLHLRKIDVGSRWQALAKLYSQQRQDGFYAFNDMHAMMSYVATGNTQGARDLLDSVQRSCEQTTTNALMNRQVGLAVLQGLLAFGEERYQEAASVLLKVRYSAHVFGGSHAQRDAIHRTLLEAAFRANAKPLALGLAAERVALKPHCSFSKGLLERAKQLTPMHQPH